MKKLLLAVVAVVFSVGVVYAECESYTTAPSCETNNGIGKVSSPLEAKKAPEMKKTKKIKKAKKAESKKADKIPVAVPSK